LPFMRREGDMKKVRTAERRQLTWSNIVWSIPRTCNIIEKSNSTLETVFCFFSRGIP
jgi:hypothetical protein